MPRRRKLRGVDFAACARETLDIEIAELRRVRDGLGPAFNAALGRMLDTLKGGGLLVLTGVGKNLPIARKIAATLTSTGAPAVVLDPSAAMHGDLGLVRPADLVLALSYSGASEELLQLLPPLRRIGVAVLAMTGEPDSPLARLSDGVINVRVEREACPFNLAPTASTTATLAVGDAMAMALLTARGFRREDYARLHPGGAIGRTLLVKVADIMRTGDRVARVGPEAPVRAAIVEMTRSRSGAVAVVDPDGRVRGIFTDGDLRRHQDDPGGLSDRAVTEVMTPDPVAIGVDQLAAEALRVFERHKIDDLVVVDAQGRLAGMIDLQDLPRMKLL